MQLIVTSFVLSRQILTSTMLWTHSAPPQVPGAVTNPGREHRLERAPQLQNSMLMVSLTKTGKGHQTHASSYLGLLESLMKYEHVSTGLRKLHIVELPNEENYKIERRDCVGFRLVTTVDGLADFVYSGSRLDWSRHICIDVSSPYSRPSRHSGYIYFPSSPICYTAFTAACKQWVEKRASYMLWIFYQSTSMQCVNKCHGHNHRRSWAISD